MDGLVMDSLDQLVPDVINEANTRSGITNNSNQDKLCINTFPAFPVMDNLDVDYSSSMTSVTTDPFQGRPDRSNGFQHPNVVKTSNSAITGYDIHPCGSKFLPIPTGPPPSSSGYMGTATTDVMKQIQMPLINSASKHTTVHLEGDVLKFIEELPINSEITIIDEAPVQAQPANSPNKQMGHCCSHCQKVFKAKRDLSRHLLIHSDSRPFQCGQCQKCFRQKMALTRHMLTHNSIRAFECEICQKSFTQKAHLKAHISVAHSNDKPHKCLICDRSFSLKTYLTLHMSTHTGEKDYVCPICHKAFSQRNNLTVHIATHSRIKLFTCRICSKQFSQKSNLNTHVKTQHNTEKYLNL